MTHDVTLALRELRRGLQEVLKRLARIDDSMRWIVKRTKKDE